MKSLLIGALIIAVGYLTQSYLLMALGLILTALDFILEKPEKIEYEYIENKPKVIVINSKPREEKIPIPAEEPSPIGAALYEKELKPLENKLKKLRIDYLASKGEAKKKIGKKISETEKDYLEKQKRLSAMPFGIKKEEGNPISGLFRGIGVNWSLKMLSHIFGEKKKK